MADHDPESVSRLDEGFDRVHLWVQWSPVVERLGLTIYRGDEPIFLDEDHHPNEFWEISAQLSAMFDLPTKFHLAWAWEQSLLPEELVIDRSGQIRGFTREPSRWSRVFFGPGERVQVRIWSNMDLVSGQIKPAEWVVPAWKEDLRVQSMVKFFLDPQSILRFCPTDTPLSEVQREAHLSVEHERGAWSLQGGELHLPNQTARPLSDQEWQHLRLAAMIGLQSTP